MTRWTVEVAAKPELTDAEGRALEHDIADIGITIPVQVRVSQMVWMDGALDDATLRTLAERLLTDPITQGYGLKSDLLHGEAGWVAEIRLKPGVTDAVGGSVRKGAWDLGIRAVETVATGKKVYLFGGLTREEAERICQRLLVNDVIQSYDLHPAAAQ